MTFPSDEDFVNLEQLALLVNKGETSLEGDAYTELIVTAAENKVRDEANQDGWVGANPGAGQTLAPPRARFIAMWLAARAWGNPLNQNSLQRETAGPISDTYFEPKVSGLDLTEDELAWLHRQSGSDGLWVQPVSNPDADLGIYVPDGAVGADPVYIDDGSSGFMYGVDS